MNIKAAKPHPVPFPECVRHELTMTGGVPLN